METALEWKNFPSDLFLDDEIDRNVYEKKETKWNLVYGASKYNTFAFWHLYKMVSYSINNYRCDGKFSIEEEEDIKEKLIQIANVYYEKCKLSRHSYMRWLMGDREIQPSENDCDFCKYHLLIEKSMKESTIQPLLQAIEMESSFKGFNAVRASLLKTSFLCHIDYEIAGDYLLQLGKRTPYAYYSLGIILLTCGKKREMLKYGNAAQWLILSVQAKIITLERVNQLLGNDTSVQNLDYELKSDLLLHKSLLRSLNKR